VAPFFGTLSIKKPAAMAVNNMFSPAIIQARFHPGRGYRRHPPGRKPFGEAAADVSGAMPGPKSRTMTRNLRHALARTPPRLREDDDPAAGRAVFQRGFFDQVSRTTAAAPRDRPRSPTAVSRQIEVDDDLAFRAPAVSNPSADLPDDRKQYRPACQGGHARTVRPATATADHRSAAPSASPWICMMPRKALARLGIVPWPAPAAYR